MSNLVQSIRDKGIEAFIEAEDSLPQSVDEIKAVAKQAANAESDWYHFVPFIGRNKREKQIDILGKKRIARYS